MEGVLIHADTVRSAEMRHEVPLPVPDAFTYGELDGRRHALVSALEAPRLRAADLGLELHGYERYGADELSAGGMRTHDVLLECALRFCRELGLTYVLVPAGFPLDLADRLRAGGVEVTADRDLFAARRRVKTEAELAGMRRAQRAAEGGMAAARELLRGRAGGLTVERLKAAIGRAFEEHGCTAEEFIVAHGAQSAIAHEMGSGPISAGEPIVIDLWPRDRESACHADMTRTYCVGEAPEELRTFHRLCKEALDLTIAAVRPGVNGAELHRLACDLFHEHGYPTGLSKEPGTVLEEGFFHGLGHGVGLEVHEEPSMGRTGDDLVAGDVITIEPGLYRPGFGGCRLEDLILVGEEGPQDLTDFPYDLEP